MYLLGVQLAPLFYELLLNTQLKNGICLQVKLGDF